MPAIVARSAALLVCLMALQACEDREPKTVGNPDDSTSLSQQVDIAVPRYSAETLLDNVTIADPGFSGDGENVVFSSDRDGVWNVYAIPSKGGEWTPVTQSRTDAYQLIAAFPEDSRLILSRRVMAGGATQIVVHEPDGNQHALTPGDGVNAYFFRFSGDRRSFYVATNERDRQQMDVYRYDTRDYRRTLIYRNESEKNPVLVSRDGTYLLMEQYLSPSNDELFLVDLATKTLSHISRHEGVARYRGMDFDKSGESVYFSSNEGGEYMRLRRYDLRRKEYADVAAEDGDIVAAYFSDSGRYRTMVVRSRSNWRVTIRDEWATRELALPQDSNGGLLAVRLSPDERQLVFLRNEDRQPNDLYVWELGEEWPRRLTATLNPAVRPESLVSSQWVRFPSFDGVVLHAVLWQPSQAPEDAPAVVWVQSSPDGQITRQFNPMAQLLANHGYRVLGVNQRGSEGFGHTFASADDRRHGTEPLWDIIEAKNYLQRTFGTDPMRIAVMGEGYGGYITMAALTFHPREFGAGVNLFGISNWVSTLERIPDWWGASREALYAEFGNPRTQRAELEAISPAFHPDQVERPMLVFQGGRDTRVVREETEAYVDALRANGVEVEYVVYPEEGRGLQRRDNQIHSMTTILDFLDRHLKWASPGLGEQSPAPEQSAQ